MSAHALQGAHNCEESYRTGRTTACESDSPRSLSGSESVVRASAAFGSSPSSCASLSESGGPSSSALSSSFFSSVRFTSVSHQYSSSDPSAGKIGPPSSARNSGAGKLRLDAWSQRSIQSRSRLITAKASGWGFKVAARLRHLMGMVRSLLNFWVKRSRYLAVVTRVVRLRVRARDACARSSNVCPARPRLTDSN